jgi:hypothetical protein
MFAEHDGPGHHGQSQMTAHLSVSYNKVGDVQVAQGDVAGAQKCRLARAAGSGVRRGQEAAARRRRYTRCLGMPAKALGLHGLLAHWQDATAAGWLHDLIEWEEQERARRSLERRLKDAHIGRFKPLCDFDWAWPKKCHKPAIEALMSLETQSWSAPTESACRPRRQRAAIVYVYSRTKLRATPGAYSAPESGHWCAGRLGRTLAIRSASSSARIAVLRPGFETPG